MATSFLIDNPELLKGVIPLKTRLESGENDSIQQSHYLKDFLEMIRTTGLLATYVHYGDDIPGPLPKPTTVAPTVPTGLTGTYDVIIVGAGMAGISAAYELKKAGLSVKILEQTDRYGGRVYTYSGENSSYNLAPGIYAEAGAMRLPGKCDEALEDRAHFMTDGYIKQFGLQIKEFKNYDKNGLSNIYGLQAKTSEWGEKHFDEVWPKWKDGIHEDMKSSIANIDVYYEQTTAIVTGQLRKWLENCVTEDVQEEIKVWGKWINMWSQFTLESFLESNIDVIKAKFHIVGKDEELDGLGKLLPWSNDALRGYSVSSYTEQLDQSLVQYLRDQMGGWWSPDMHRIDGGMHSLPEAFFRDPNGLEEDADVVFNKTVSKITFTYYEDDPDSDFVKVACNLRSDQPVEYKAKAVIVATPVNILRQIMITFERVDDNGCIPAPSEETLLSLRKTQQAIEDIFTGPSTKIFLQTKRRFWEYEPYYIEGGFSKTNLPIGQLHYVTREYAGGNEEEKKKGLLLIYTWKNEALIFGSLTQEEAKKEAIRQVAVIHPEILYRENEVDVCIVHAWYNQPSYQGAYGLLKTTQFDNIRHLWKPMGNVHFAGETFSFAAGWIQGALESGLKAAYQVYSRHMKRH